MQNYFYIESMCARYVLPSGETNKSYFIMVAAFFSIIT